jgi:hypothetical protein
MNPNHAPQPSRADLERGLLSYIGASTIAHRLVGQLDLPWQGSVIGPRHRATEESATENIAFVNEVLADIGGIAITLTSPEDGTAQTVRLQTWLGPDHDSPNTDNQVWGISDMRAPQGVVLGEASISLTELLQDLQPPTAA